RDFLAPLHEPPRRAGALDHLLGLDVVPASEPPAEGEPARFELRRTGVEREATTTTLEVTRPNRRRAPWLALGAAAVVAAGGLVAWRMAAPAGGSAIAPRDAVAAAPRDAAAPRIVVEPGDAPAPPPADAAVPLAIDAGVVHRGVHRAPRDAAAAEPAAPAGTGFVVIGGDESLIGAQIVVDGRVRDEHAPTVLELGRGHHRIQLIDKTGAPLATKDVELTEYTTRAHPARLAW
ncbi:MAG TPA: hypothetical protein VLX92_33935, partial [Kofleriaceae bacterium]|nr:hypothetical protein [Kofleriaceae bacterium]